MVRKSYYRGPNRFGTTDEYEARCKRYENMKVGNTVGSARKQQALLNAPFRGIPDADIWHLDRIRLSGEYTPANIRLIPGSVNMSEQCPRSEEEVRDICVRVFCYRMDNPDDWRDPLYLSHTPTKNWRDNERQECAERVAGRFTEGFARLMQDKRDNKAIQPTSSRSSCDYKTGQLIGGDQGGNASNQQDEGIVERKE